MKKEWTPTADAFRHFLSWLDDGGESHGQKYLEMRRRLVLYFDRKNCLTADELADETLTRVARKLEEQGSITDLSPAHYCYVTAKFVFLEYLRRSDRGHTSLEELTQPNLSPANRENPGLAAQESLLDALDHCLDQLPRADRELILEYYRGEGRRKIERRQKLAQRLGVSANALNIRACRIRNKVEECVTKFSGGA